jgi:HSP20 family molecular chaperone IbpA
MTGLLAPTCRIIASREVTIVKARADREAHDEPLNPTRGDRIMASRFLVPARQGGALQRTASLDPLLILQRDMDRLFGSALRSFIGSDGDGELVLAPRIDVREVDGGIEVDAELPGVDG